MASQGLNLRPLADRLIVEAIEQEEVTSSGLYIPETAKEKPQQGNVLAAGPGRTGRPCRSMKDRAATGTFSNSSVTASDSSARRRNPASSS